MHYLKTKCCHLQLTGFHLSAYMCSFVRECLSWAFWLLWLLLMSHISVILIETMGIESHLLKHAIIFSKLIAISFTILLIGYLISDGSLTVSIWVVDSANQQLVIWVARTAIVLMLILGHSVLLSVLCTTCKVIAIYLYLLQCYRAIINC